MKRRRVIALLPAVLLSTTALLLSFAKGPLPKHTGGFGEETCTACHDDHKLNEGRARGGVFQIEGAPKTYVAGQTYPLTVVIGQPGQVRWGFQLSARFADTGRQAGKLLPVDEFTQVVQEGGIQYMEHTLAGTRPRTADGPVEFHFNWMAPESSGAQVLFNAAGNAADNSNSPMGDYIYTAGAWSGLPAPAASAGVAPAQKKESKWGERIIGSSKVVDLPAPMHLRKGAFQVLIQHRFFEAIPDSSPGDAFGIDSGANINLGVNYALTNRLSMGVARARFDEVIAWTGTFEIQTRNESFWKMSLLGGVEGQRNFERQYSPYLQLATSFDYKGVRMYVVPTAVFHSWSRQLVKQFPAQVINPDSHNTFSMGFGSDVAINKRFSLVGEIVPRLAGFGGVDRHRPTVSGGFEIRTWKHVFTILVSSSRDFTPAKYAVNPGQKDVSLGFNIYRLIR